MRFLRWIPVDFEERLHSYIYCVLFPPVGVRMLGPRTTSLPCSSAFSTLKGCVSKLCQVAIVVFD